MNDGIASISYYLDTEVLSTRYASGIIHLLYPVPRQAAQRFQTIGYGVSPDQIWSQIRYSYREILQSQVNCPLMAQDGAYLLSAPQHDVPH